MGPEIEVTCILVDIVKVLQVCFYIIIHLFLKGWLGSFSHYDIIPQQLCMKLKYDTKNAKLRNDNVSWHFGAINLGHRWL